MLTSIAIKLPTLQICHPLVCLCLSKGLIAIISNILKEQHKKKKIIRLNSKSNLLFCGKQWAYSFWRLYEYTVKLYLPINQNGPCPVILELVVVQLQLLVIPLWVSTHIKSKSIRGTGVDLHSIPVQMYLFVFFF